MDLDSYVSESAARDWQTADGGTVRLALVGLGAFAREYVLPALERDRRGARTGFCEITTHAPDPEFEGVDEHVAFQLEFPNAATASCTASYRAQADDRLRLVGTEGQAELTPAFDSEIHPTLALDVGDERVEYTGPYVNEVAEEFDYFAHCVLTGETPEPDGRDGVADVEAVEAIYESAESGRRVTVGEPD